MSLSLFNPTRTIAVVDLSFVSSTGLLAPPAYQGIDVPADTLEIVNIGDHVQNTAHFATTVTALSGAVVAAELESTGRPAAPGASVVLGTRAPASTWSFAQNIEMDSGSTVFHVFNPSDRPVQGHGHDRTATGSG